MAQEVIQDVVNVSFSVEEAIKSDTVKITIQATLAVKAAEAIDVRGQIVTALKNVIDTDWAFVSLDRREDDAGLERVSATATARIPEADAAGLASKCQTASVAGLKLTPGAVDYSPARNVVDEAITKLRRKIYALAQEEAEALEDAAGKVAKGKWRVGEINFSAGASFANNGMRAKGMMLESAGYSAAPAALGGGAEGMDLTQKVQLVASVALHRTVLGAEK